MWITATTGTLESRPRPITNVLKGALMGILCAVLAACPSETIQSHSGPLPRDSLDEVLARGKLRVVSRVNPATFVVDKHGPSGIEFELARAFAEKIGVELEMIPAANIAEVYAALDSGTSCLRPAFMRSAGIVHSLASRFTSSHVMPRTSPLREPVRIANSSAFTETPSRLRSSAMKAGTSAHGKAL